MKASFANWNRSAPWSTMVLNVLFWLDILWLLPFFLCNLPSDFSCTCFTWKDTSSESKILHWLLKLTPSFVISLRHFIVRITWGGSKETLVELNLLLTQIPGWHQQCLDCFYFIYFYCCWSILTWRFLWFVLRFKVALKGTMMWFGKWM